MVTWSSILRMSAPSGTRWSVVTGAATWSSTTRSRGTPARSSSSATTIPVRSRPARHETTTGPVDVDARARKMAAMFFALRCRLLL